jgi:hypothetical protein
VRRLVALADVRLDLDDAGDPSRLALALVARGVRLADESRADQASGGLERRSGEQPPEPLT